MPSLDLLLLRGPQSGDIVAGLDELRYQILRHGIPSNSDGMSELRIYVWLILLNAPPVQTNVYLDLVGQGPSPAYSKIRNDTFRTLATDPLFRRRVTENSLTRVLNAVAWKLHDAHEARVNGWQSPPTLEMGGGARHHTFPLPPPREASLADTTGTTEDDSEIDVHPITTSTTAATTTTDALPPPATPPDQPSYVQGMNVLAAPFLYAARSETEAFAAFSVLVTRECPGYVRGSMEGVHRGLALVDKILAVVEPRLAAHLVAKGLNAEIYAFASVLTMCACTPPLPEVLRLWDFLFAYGCHLNLVCVVAQLVMIKDQLLSSSSPNQILRSFPPLRTEKIKGLAISLAGMIPSDLYEQIVMHAK